MIAGAGAELERDLVGYLHRRALREEAILRPLLRELTDVRIQKLSPEGAILPAGE